MNESSKPLAFFTDLLDLHLARSGKLPLNVLVTLPRSWTAAEEDFGNMLLAKVADRVQSLMLFNPRESMTSQFSNAMPVLKQLCLVFNYNWLPEASPPWTLSITGAPSLSHFVYRGRDFELPPTHELTLPWASVTRFDAWQLHGRPSLEVLRKCPNLEFYGAAAGADMMGSLVDFNQQEYQPIVLPRLRTFECPGYYGKAVTDLLERIHMPELRSLTLRFAFPMLSCFRPWKVFLYNLPKTITHLKLCSFYPRHYEGDDDDPGHPDVIFEYMPRLQVLEVDSPQHGYLEEICDALSLREASGGLKYAPALRLFVVISRSTPESGSPEEIQQQLQRMLAARYTGYDALSDHEFKVEIGYNRDGQPLYDKVSLEIGD
ncbi:hypothetical protein D9756_002695 [Leucocoprinus leucothites]|uniref:Uncharacterized protein n=1 Tax=Leucocoprinus leucothites TaxID=201217 RepID=A0A8H5GC40_9AGAR|nr:hypothetical protein D9756_002695 [Leucoagaricus leucothites]